jgi:hypothetical protein
MTNVADQRAKVDEIDFNILFTIFWQRRKLIVFGTLAATLLAAVLNFFIPKTYRSEGFFQLANPILEGGELIGMPIPFYKKNITQFFNPKRFHLFARQEKSFSNKDLKKIRTSFRSAADISKWFIPIFAYSKEDMQMLPKPESNSVIGVKLRFEYDSPRKTYAFVYLFGQYVRDCLLYVSLYDYVMDNYINTTSQMNSNEIGIFETKFKLLQNSKKMLDIKAILTKYPASAKIENRQVISVQDGGDRFLGPVTQLVGIESQLADLRQELIALEREKEMLLIMSEYFFMCKDSINKVGESGELLFSQLKSIKSELFKTKDFRKDVVKNDFNKLSNDLQAFDLVFYSKCHFIYGPTFPVKHIKNSIIILTCLLSFFFFIFLSVVLYWWKNNKKAILSANPKQGQ